MDVKMFGAIRNLPAGPVLLSLFFFNDTATTEIYTTDAGWHCRIDRPLEIERSGEMRADVTALTRALAGEFERAISAKPTDWHMFQPAWESDGSAQREPSRVALPT